MFEQEVRNFRKVKSLLDTYTIAMKNFVRITQEYNAKKENYKLLVVDVDGTYLIEGVSFSIN